MLPLIVGGVFLVGLIVGKKSCEPSRPWSSREGEERFQRERERWRDEGWML
jgi:hypothetical protein